MAMFNNMSMLVTIFKVLCATMLISGGVFARILPDYPDGGDYDPHNAISHFFPAAPPVPNQCQISESCGHVLFRLLLTSTLPKAKDADCCGEIVERTKFCWDSVINSIEALTEFEDRNLHPWSDNTWNTCLMLSVE